MSGLTAGVASGDITPPLGVPMAGYGARTEVASSLRDELMAQALVLRCGQEAAALLCIDNIGLETGFVALVRERTEAVTGIPGDRVMICCSHTHWGPMTAAGKYVPGHLRSLVSADYNERLIATLVALVAEADAARVAAVAGVGEGFADGVTFNRRLVGPDFKTAMHLVLEPPLAAIASHEGNRLAKQWQPGEHRGPRLSKPLAEMDGARVGPSDSAVTLLRLDKSDGTPLAGMYNFACHGVCGAGPDSFYAISADWAGQARAAFAALVGAPLLYAYGCAGDQVPRWRQDDSRVRVGRSVGAEAAHAWWSIDEKHGDLPLEVAVRTVKLPLNPCIPSVAAAREALAAKPDPEGTEAVHERHTLAMAEELEGLDGYPAELWALRLGNLGLVGIPGEVLNEIGLQIRQRSPFEHTMVLSLANGSIGYLPTDDAIVAGGYEPEWSPVGPGTERVLVDSALELLESLYRS